MVKMNLQNPGHGTIAASRGFALVLSPSEEKTVCKEISYCVKIRADRVDEVAAVDNTQGFMMMSEGTTPHHTEHRGRQVWWEDTRDCRTLQRDSLGRIHDAPSGGRYMNDAYDMY